MKAKAFGLLAPFLLSAFAVNAAKAEEVKIVFPNGFENVEGNSAAGLGNVFSTDGMRYQLVYDASQFASLPDTHNMLTAILLRPDGDLADSFSLPAENLELRLSITDRNPGELSSFFAENIGVRQTTVYQGPITFSSNNEGPIGGPKAFDYGIYFQTPFSYDPAEGNLLYDLTVFGETFTVGQDVQDSPDNPSEWVIALDSDATRATDRGQDLAVSQFVFIPEPAAGLLMIVELVALTVLARRTKRR